ncbi:SpoIIE family protein phosphatase [Streptomyces sp. RS10V-4]|uniref:SpoIIE family protein phosphatase n=1 Tax=Streptomyces rhizoryzae TaxID=2932493 RepID=UPI002005E0F1|nr:SpoIIE family protein phosphatase [Streptomyces rhizoryzae]MCK7623185.1 SpoIIE family protein phosphatase [Streptomyces rhizoryzae]
MNTSPSSRLPLDGAFDLTRTAVVPADRTGVVRGWTAGAERLLGVPAARAVGRPLAEVFAAPQPPAGPPEGFWAQRLAAPDGWSGPVAVRHRDGHRLDLEVRVLPVLAAADGSARLVLAAELTRTPWSGAGRSLLTGILGMSPIGVAMLDRDLRYVWLNDALERMGGAPRAARLGKRLSEVLPDLAVESVEAEMRRVLRTGTPSVGYEYLGRPRSDPRREHAYSTSFFRLEDESGGVLGLCYMVLDVTESYRARQRMALLNRAGERIGGSLDVWRTAQELAEVAVPDLADFVTVDLLDTMLSAAEPASGPVRPADLLTIRRAGQHSVRRGCPEAVSAIGDRTAYPPSSPVVLSLTEGESVLIPALDLDHADWAADDPVRARQLRALGFHSLMVVPLRARGSFLGAAAFARWRPTGPFQPDDLVLAEEFVTRAAISIDNARRYTREHTAALTLQRSLLPRDLPEQSAVEAAYRYLPADSLTGVGGDWFDVIPLSGARVALVVGDVVGHGVHAAATMGRLRAAVQALAGLDLAPDEVLAHLDDMVHRVAHDAHSEDGVVGATCLYAVYDPVACCCTLSRAGHPAPLLVGPAGGSQLLELPTGPPLGLGGMPFESAEVPLPEGSLLALYTNGLLLGKALDPDGGITRLRTALADPQAPLEQICDTVVASLPGTRPVDDVALLLARTRALPQERLAAWEVPADPSAVGAVRRSAAGQLARWDLADLEFSTELIVSELVTNALRHASGPIGLRMIRAEALICEVSDGSSTAPHLRHARTTDEGGRGLFLIARYARRWGARYTAHGKVIWAELPLDAAAPAADALTGGLDALADPDGLDGGPPAPLTGP